MSEHKHSGDFLDLKVGARMSDDERCVECGHDMAAHASNTNDGCLAEDHWDESLGMWMPCPCERAQTQEPTP